MEAFDHIFPTVRGSFILHILNKIHRKVDWISMKQCKMDIICKLPAALVRSIRHNCQVNFCREIQFWNFLNGLLVLKLFQLYNGNGTWVYRLLTKSLILDSWTIFTDLKWINLVCKSTAPMDGPRMAWYSRVVEKGILFIGKY